MHLHTELQTLPCISRNLLPWYAIRTKSNQEKLVSTILSNKDFEIYFPVYRVCRRWSDRVVETELPLFPGYVFGRLDIVKRMPILTTPGVVRILSVGHEPAAIPEEEIEAVRTVLRSGLLTEPCPFIREGQRIRVHSGSLKGQEGILLKKKNKWRMVVSITLLQRSVSVEIDRECIAAL